MDAWDSRYGEGSRRADQPDAPGGKGMIMQRSLFRMAERETNKLTAKQLQTRMYAICN